MLRLRKQIVSIKNSSKRLSNVKLLKSDLTVLETLSQLRIRRKSSVVVLNLMTALDLKKVKVLRRYSHLLINLQTLKSWSLPRACLTLQIKLIRST